MIWKSSISYLVEAGHSQPGGPDLPPSRVSQRIEAVWPADQYVVSMQ